MINQDEPIAVANTFVKRWEMEWYVNLAQTAGWSIVEITVKSDFLNVHGVPAETIKRMREQFEP